MINKINCLDCLEGMKQINNNSISLIIIDPPYSTPVITGFGRKKMKNIADLSIQEQYMIMLKKEFERILKENAPIFIFCDDKYFPSLYRAFYDWNSLQLIVWDKGKIGMGKPFRKQHELILYANKGFMEYFRNGITYSTIMKYKPVPINDRFHPAQKPLSLVRDLIKGFTKEQDIILDCFMGSGTTALASIQLNRKFIGYDLNQDFVDIANKRLEQENLISFTKQNQKNSKEIK